MAVTYLKWPPLLSQAVTYFTNPSFPATDSSPLACLLRIAPPTDVCYVQLDYEVCSLQQTNKCKKLRKPPPHPNSISNAICRYWTCQAWMENVPTIQYLCSGGSWLSVTTVTNDCFLATLSPTSKLKGLFTFFFFYRSNLIIRPLRPKSAVPHPITIPKIWDLSDWNWWTIPLRKDKRHKTWLKSRSKERGRSSWKSLWSQGRLCHSYQVIIIVIMVIITIMVIIMVIK